MEQFYLEAFDGMERLAPGSHGTTLLASRSIPRKKEVEILEIACGVGVSSIALAKACPLSRITAMDSSIENVEKVQEKAEKEQVASQISAVVMSFEDMDFGDKKFDVIWMEGSVYQFGFEKALGKLKGLLAPKGQIIVNDLCWIREHVPPECVDYWNAQYPDIDFQRGRSKIAEELGFSVLSSSVQPLSDWTENYYKPLLENLRGMRDKYESKKKGRGVKEAQKFMGMIEELGKEANMYAKYSACYSYVMFSLQLKDE